MHVIVTRHHSAESTDSLADFHWLRRLPRQAITHDWYGTEVIPVLEFAFGVDEENLWFLATRAAGASIPPDAKPGAFTPELWKYDVAEFFLHHPATGQYWEFNLCPSGAWWSCGFQSPRVQEDALTQPLSGVETLAELQEDSWLCMARIPLDSLAPIVGGQPGGESLKDLTLAVTGILETPEQIFLTTCDYLDGEPDFHRPHLFSRLLILP